MKEIVTSNAKKRNKKKDKDKKILKHYWSILYPEEYSSLLVQFDTSLVKTAKLSDRKEEKIVGKLKQTDDGFLYLDLPDSILDSFVPMIGDDKAKKPPYNTKKMNNVGAHVSVAYKDEVEDIKIKEIGKEFSLGLKKFISLDPEGWNEMSRVWFLEVECKELEKLRKSYGLTNKLNGHEFHITVAIRKSK